MPISLIVANSYKALKNSHHLRCKTLFKIPLKIIQIYIRKIKLKAPLLIKGNLHLRLERKIQLKRTKMKIQGMLPFLSMISKMYKQQAKHREKAKRANKISILLMAENKKLIRAVANLELQSLLKRQIKIVKQIPL